MNKKFFILISFLILHSSFFILHSYSQSWLWARSGIGSYDLGNEQGNSVATDKNGNVYVGGIFWSTTITFGSYTLTNTGSYANSFLVKYDSNGNVLWAKCLEGIAGSIYAMLDEVTIDNRGNVIIIGIYFEPGLVFGKDTLTLLNNNSDWNIFLVKYDANGNVLWATSPTASNLNAFIINAASGIVTDSLNNIYVTGVYGSLVRYTNPDIIFGKDTLTLVNENDSNGNMFIVKYDSNGNVLWAKNGYSSGDGSPGGMAIDKKDNLYISGTIFSDLLTFGPDTLKEPTGRYNIFLAKYDANGNILWAKGYGGDCYNIGLSDNGLALDKEDNIYLGGEFGCDTVLFGPDTLYGIINSPFWTPYVVKLDNNGNPLWAKLVGSGGIYNSVYATTIKQDRSICFTGIFCKPNIIFGNDTLINKGVEDIFVAEYSTTGNLLWAESIGWRETQNACYGITTDLKGYIYVTGTQQDTLNFGSDTLRDYYSSVFIAKLSDPIITGQKELKTIATQNVTVYPNPNNGEFNIQWIVGSGQWLENTHTIEIFDVYGQKIYSSLINQSHFGKLNATLTTIHLNVPDGIYFYRVLQEDGEILGEGKIIIAN